MYKVKYISTRSGNLTWASGKWKTKREAERVKKFIKRYGWGKFVAIVKVK